MRYLLLFMLLWFSSLQGRTFEVSGGGEKLQEAVNSASAGDSIIVMDDREYGQVTIENKSNIVLISQAYLDKGENRFAGGMPRIKYQDTENTRPHNEDEALDKDFAEEYSKNGALRILTSKNISVIGFNVDGGGVWQEYYKVWGGPQLFGNNAIALFNSGKITVRGCMIHGAYRGIHHKDRNIAGIFVEKNPNDVDVDEFSPAGNPLAMGGHIIEQNMIYENHWGIYLEILWDAASTYRNNLIFYNGMKNPDYVITRGDGDPRNGVDKINWIEWSGAAIKVHGVKYVPVVFNNNTFYKNMLTFQNHWLSQNGSPNFRFYCNLFGRYDEAYNDVMRNSDIGTAYESIFATYAAFETKYIGLANFNFNAISKLWTGEGGYGYVARAEFDGKTEPQGGELLDIFSGSVTAMGEENYYLGQSNDDTFYDRDDRFSNDFLKPKSGIREIENRGARTQGQYDIDLSKADAGAIDVNGNWAGTGTPVIIYDRDRYAVVDFMKDGETSVDIRFRMEYEGKKIDKIEYVYQKYSASIETDQVKLPELHDIDLKSSNINDDEKKELLSNGDMVEIRYVGNASEFTKDSKEYARFMLRVKVTDVDGNEFWSNTGYFDYKKVNMKFNITLADYVDGGKGDEWPSDDISEVYVYEPFWMSIATTDENGDPKDMTQYNDQEVIVTQSEQPELWTQLWKWDSDEPVDIASKPGEDERWKQMDPSTGSNYLNKTWNEQGEWEGVFVFSKPSVGEEHLRVNLKGADDVNSTLSGTSNGFVILAEPDTIVYVRATDVTVENADLLAYQDGQATMHPALEQLVSVGLVVRDVDQNLLANQDVTLTIADSELGSFVNSSGESVSEITVRTSISDGVASFLFQAGNTKGKTGDIIASVKGKGDAVITANLKVNLIYADNRKARPRPNVLFTTKINKTIDPENLNENQAKLVNEILSRHNVESNNPASNELILLDFKINSKTYPVGSKFKIRALVTNAQGNLVKEIVPNKSGGSNPVYVISDMEDGGDLQIEKSSYAKFTGVGEVETTSPGQDVRVALPWNHINENGRVAEAGVFIVVFVVEAPDGNTDRVKSYYIIK